jgi:GTP pyrophosphokinase
MTEQPQHGLAEPLLAQLSGRFSQEELDQVAHAFDVADHCHEGQWRKSGDRYITHPLAVAEAAATLGLGCTMVCAALLHDVLEDTDCDPELLRAEFGAEVADVVTRYTALGHGEGAPDDDQAITLKLLDRLHNMRTIEYLDADRQLSGSRQTLELLVPQARLLGLPVVADELQELARHRIELLAGEGGGSCAPSGSARSCCLRRPGTGTWRNGPPS